MSLLIESEIRALARNVVVESRNLSAKLTERVNKQVSIKAFDVFLSHAYDDRELVEGMALAIERRGYTVYLDWREDPSLDRKNVTKATAEILRDRMISSRCLLYAITENSGDSKWMPWELGFKDGHSQRVAVVPIAKTPTIDYKGVEYLGVYPYISDQTDTGGRSRLWVRYSPTCYVVFDEWLAGTMPFARR